MAVSSNNFLDLWCNRWETEAASDGMTRLRVQLKVTFHSIFKLFEYGESCAIRPSSFPVYYRKIAVDQGDKGWYVDPQSGQQVL
jgi:hypothetical protein